MKVYTVLRILHSYDFMNALLLYYTKCCSTLKKGITKAIHKATIKETTDNINQFII